MVFLLEGGEGPRAVSGREHWVWHKQPQPPGLRPTVLADRPLFLMDYQWFARARRTVQLSSALICPNYLG